MTTVTSQSRKFRPGITGTPRPKPDRPSDATAPPAGAGSTREAATPAPEALHPGSVTAKVIARIWRGGELTIVDSPPGAGKTALVVTTAAHLAMRADMKILIGTPTRAQGKALLDRLATQIPAKYLESGINGVLVPGPVIPSSDKECRVRVSTLAKCKLTDDRSRFNLLIVDEAYQATNAIVSGAVSGVGQVLMVGDPGQIGPVVTIDTSIWRGTKNAPHVPAPECVDNYDDVERFSLDRSWRLGPASAAAIAPIYRFPFASANIARSATTNDGKPVNEIEVVEVPRTMIVDDIGALTAVVDRVGRLIGGKLTGPQADGTVSHRTIEGSDITVVVSRNSQVSIVTGLLRQRCLSGVVVGTADRLQGNEWPIVVAFDPTSGTTSDQNEHNLSIGRLCVMASRHNTHLTWVHDGGWKELLTGGNAAAKAGRAVREALVGARDESPVPPSQ